MVLGQVETAKDVRLRGKTDAPPGKSEMLIEGLCDTVELVRRDVVAHPVGPVVYPPNELASRSWGGGGARDVAELRTGEEKVVWRVRVPIEADGVADAKCILPFGYRLVVRAAGLRHP
jgi:hypothetical protein